MSYYNYKRAPQYASKAEYVEFMRGTIGPCTDVTYTEDEIEVPISRSYGNNRALAVAIHAVEWYFEALSGITADGEYIHAHLSKKTKAAWASPASDADIIDAVQLEKNVGAAGEVDTILPIIHHYPKPILIGNNKLYIGAYINSTGNVVYVKVRIHFTPRFVSDNQLMEALID